MTEELAEKDSGQGPDPEEQVADEQEPSQRSNGVVTVVLTADNHLGYVASGQQPRKREEREQQLRKAFQRATDFAIGQGVDLFIQAGDLFDTLHPDERDRSFVADRLGQLRQAGVRTFAVGGVHDTPSAARARLGDGAPAPQISFARLGALHYFEPPVPSNGGTSEEDDEHGPEPVLLDIAGLRVGLYGLSVRLGQEGDPLAAAQHLDDIERADIRILILHAPIEGLADSSTPLAGRAQVSRESIARQKHFQYILAGYHHDFRRLRIGQCEVVVAGATQRIDFGDPEAEPGFVFLGLAADGIRWCKHIALDSLHLRRLVLQTSELWPQSRQDAADQTDGGEQAEVAEKQGEEHVTPTQIILERLQPLCSEDTLVQLQLEGPLTRAQYHELDFNQLRRYGEQHCFSLSIDDSGLALLPGEADAPSETSERFSPREELVCLADEWIAAAKDEQEQKALRITKEELLAAMDSLKGQW